MHANPQMPSLLVMQEVGRQWQNLTEPQRVYFQHKADRDKVRYLREMRAFYDEVERIGKTYGTVRQSDGNIHVNTVSKPKQNLETFPAKPPVKEKKEEKPAKFPVPPTQANMTIRIDPNVSLSAYKDSEISQLLQQTPSSMIQVI